MTRIVPHGWWKRRFDALIAQEQNNPLLTPYFEAELAIERAYGRIHKYRSHTGRYPDVDIQSYEFFSFVASLVLVHQRLTTKGQQRLKMNVRDGLQDSKGLAPLATELRTATHLMQQGYNVEFTDFEGTAQFDLLATRQDLEIEVDCKAPSGDVGRKIHGARFRALAGKLEPALKNIVDSGRYYLVVVTIPKNLHGDRSYERRLVEEISYSLQREPLTFTTSVAEIVVTKLEGADIIFDKPGFVTD